MFDDENDPDQTPSEGARDPAEAAKEKSDEFRMHAELAAIFEATRKFEAQIIPGLDPDLARDVQKRIAKLERSKVAQTPLIAEASAPDAADLLALPVARDLSTNDYHIHRRPGEVMIVRWIAGDEVDAFYTRLQAHFDAALSHYRTEERQSQEWKQDERTMKYLDALDEVKVKMADRYLRDVIRKHRVFALSTQTADELDILHLCEFLMGAPAAEVVGPASAPPEHPTERDRAWFFKLFSLRGILEDVERMCFFVFLQKTEDTFEGGW